MSLPGSPFVEIPFGEDGRPDLQSLAYAILLDLEEKPAGYKLLIPANLEGEPGVFQARYEPNARMTVQRECLDTRFGITLFKALQALAPLRIHIERQG